MEKGEFIFTTKSLVSDLIMGSNYDHEIFHDVSSYGFLNVFSPFYAFNQVIPVPGSPEKRSKSVEGVWQGSKIINNKIDESQFFLDRAKKRRVSNYSTTKFMYGDEEIGVIEARKKIFVPAYKFVIDNLIPTEYLENFIRTSIGGVYQRFYDVEDNYDINNPNSSYSHAALLVDILYTKRNNVRKQVSLDVVDHIEISDVISGDVDYLQSHVDSVLYNTFLPVRVADFAGHIYSSVCDIFSDISDRADIFNSLLGAYANKFGYSIGDDSRESLFTESDFDSKLPQKKIVDRVRSNLYYI